MNSKIKLIVFDFWHTLAYRNIDYWIGDQIIKRNNLKINHREYKKIFEKVLQTKKWKSKFNAYKLLCKNLGIPTTKEKVTEIMNFRSVAEKKTRLYKHVLKMLREIKKQGYKLGVVSNTSIFEYDVIKKLRVLKYFDYEVFAFQVGVVKPHPEIFRRILKKANVKPSEVLMIGDDLKDDVKTPVKIGMNALHFKDYSTLKKDMKKFGINI